MTAGATACWFQHGDAPPVRFVFEDELRCDALDVVAARGLSVIMLSGDRPRPVVTGTKIAIVGDGLNDAPSLAAAHASLSPGTAADARVKGGRGFRLLG